MDYPLDPDTERFFKDIVSKKQTEIDKDHQLLAQFAAAALTGLISSDKVLHMAANSSDERMEDGIATLAFEAAEAMMKKFKERTK